jgi:hypothetical protein
MSNWRYIWTVLDLNLKVHLYLNVKLLFGLGILGN